MTITVMATEDLTIKKGEVILIIDGEIRWVESSAVNLAIETHLGPTIVLSNQLSGMGWVKKLWPK